MSIVVRNQALVRREDEDRTARVLEATKAYFCRKNRTLLHSFLPHVPLKDLDGILAAAWDTLSEAERSVYISEVGGSSAQKASSTMINPLLQRVPNIASLNLGRAISHGDSSVGPPPATQVAVPSRRYKWKRKNESAPRRAKKPNRTKEACTGAQRAEDVPLEGIDPSEALRALEAEGSAGDLFGGIADDELDDYSSFLDNLVEQQPTAGIPGDNEEIKLENSTLCFGMEYNFNAFLNKYCVVDTNAIVV
jgi:hypothetical protein